MVYWQGIRDFNRRQVEVEVSARAEILIELLLHLPPLP